MRRNIFARLMRREPKPSVEVRLTSVDPHKRSREIGTVTVNPDAVGVGFKGRARIEAVKRGLCDRCGGTYGFHPELAQCKCPEGWTGEEINLGVIAESRIG
jgi:hypothetical protein